MLSSLEPSVLEETSAYAVVYKPPLWHSAPLKGDEHVGDPSARILLFWYARRCPAVLAVRGRKAGEGGLLHRLDYETEGLVLLAKTQRAMDAIARQQREGLFTKEYGALSRGNREEMPGFPPPVLWGEPHTPESAAGRGIPGPAPFTIQSAFRPFGPGRREVRPVVLTGGGKLQKRIALDQGKPYKTEVLDVIPRGEQVYFRLGINRGFRHQIRCHLAWLGYAILNDKTYGGRLFKGGVMALRAQGLCFYDPESKDPRNYRIMALDESRNRSGTGG
ncbi:MAG: RNA pseudouridine synthase [Spirochaetaceae bacterium]|jgi:23S rRNA pseudouridine1911/1915/1917 synthase|nr:RNA pseudouridine synthase [Spirochaetaceae bacterium]